MYPKPIKKRSGGTSTLPAHLSSEQMVQYHVDKEQKKLQEETEKENRKEDRKRKKGKKEEQKEE